MPEVAPPVLASRRVVACAFAGTALVGALWLQGHPPSTSSWYPQCLFHKLTGMHCPGCGATRAMYALLHGRVMEALHQNALATLLLPFLAVAASRSLWRWTWGLPPPLRPISNQFVLRLILWAAPLIILFGIARNLPWSPFTYLAPH